MLTAIYAARNIFGGDFDVWEVNIEQDYHEEQGRAPRQATGSFPNICQSHDVSVGGIDLAKAVITVAILVVVLLRVDLSAVAKALRHVNWPLFLLAVGLSFPIGFTAIQRWRYVAATFGEELPLSKAFVYAWIGQFINLGLPTVVGLDLVRAWKMHKQGITIGLATRIVVIDRLCSLFTLLIVIAVAMPHLSALQGSEIFKQSAILAFVLAAWRWPAFPRLSLSCAPIPPPT